MGGEKSQAGSPEWHADKSDDFNLTVTSLELRYGF
jgi:hypothetical protein